MSKRTQEDIEKLAAHSAYAGLHLVRHVGNAWRRQREVPDYVSFTLTGTYPDLPLPRRPWQRLLLPQPESLRELAGHLRAVAEDPRIRGVVIHVRPLEIPITRLETLRDLIGELRANGKHVATWSSRYTTSSYYVACAADEIILQPGGEVAPLGLHRSFMFLADTLAKAGLAVDGIQITPYKTALDTFTRREISDEAREMADWLMDATFDELVAAIASGRGLSREEAQLLIDEAPYTDETALDRGVVDHVATEEELPQLLASVRSVGTVSTPHTGGTGSSRAASDPALTDARQPAGAQGDKAAARIDTWHAVRHRVQLRAPQRPGRHVAVLRIEGTIVDGESARPPSDVPLPLPIVAEPRSGDLTVVREVRRLARDQRVAAVVAFIDSPGGSATASEAMAAAMAGLAQRKPLVAAMGSVAASGGYYVATPAQWIVAQPDTITGSIGVLMGKLVDGGLLDRLDIGREHLVRGRHADLYPSEEPFSDEEREVMWSSIRRVYDVFLQRVADSRGISIDALEGIAGGRVWTGRQALERGLVDELGSLDTALAKARSLADLHPRAPAVDAPTVKVPLAPIADPTAALTYAAESLRLLAQAGALTLCPIELREEF
jgi:protease-4